MCSREYYGLSSERTHDACKICGTDADVTFVNQETGLCNACERGVFI